VADLRASKQLLVEAGVYKKMLDERTFREQMDALNEQLALAETTQHDARLDELDIEGVLAFAEEILARPSRFWGRGDVRPATAVATRLVPGRRNLRSRRIWHRRTSFIYRMLRLVGAEKQVSPAGFELRHRREKPPRRES
jgi:hypothetical protein